MATRVAAGVAKKAGLAAGVAAAAAGSAAENRAAPPDETIQVQDDGTLTLTESHLHVAAEALKEQFSEMQKNQAAQGTLAAMKEEGFLTTSFSENGTEWLDVGGVLNLDNLSEMIDLAETVAAAPAVQRTIMEKAQQQQKTRDHNRNQALTLRLLDEQPQLSGGRLGSPTSAPPTPLGSVSLAESELCVVQPPADAANSLSSSSLGSFSTSFSDVLAAENELLKRENARLKQQLGDSDKPGNSRPGVARVQAAARGHLARLGFYDPRAVLLPPKPPTVKANLHVATFSDPEGEVASLPIIRVRLSVCPTEAPRQRDRPSTAPPAATSTSSPQRALAKDALVVGLSVIMGLLALAIMRNPRAARAAAAGAAATVAALVSRSKQRSEL